MDITINDNGLGRVAIVEIQLAEQAKYCVYLAVERIREISLYLAGVIPGIYAAKALAVFQASNHA